MTDVAIVLFVFGLLLVGVIALLCYDLGSLRQAVRVAIEEIHDGAPEVAIIVLENELDER